MLGSGETETFSHPHLPVRFDAHQEYVRCVLPLKKKLLKERSKGVGCACNGYFSYCRQKQLTEGREEGSVWAHS